jgi:hypothetical protein
MLRKINPNLVLALTFVLTLLASAPVQNLGKISWNT